MNHPPTLKTNVAAISIFASAGMAAAKFVVGIAIGSLALISEALHSSVDVVATVIASQRRGDSDAIRGRHLPRMRGIQYAAADRFSH